MEFFEGMDVFLKTLWVMAAIASPILVFQIIGTFMGMDADGMDADFEVDEIDEAGDAASGAFQMWTLRNFVAFFAMFAWTGIVCREQGLSNGLSAGISLISGSAMVIAISLLFYAMTKLQEDGTPKLTSAIGNVATVYLTIPENGAGKITVSIGGSTREVSARSKNGKLFKSNDKVKVVEYDGAEYIVDSI